MKTPKKKYLENERKNETYVCNVCGKNFYKKASLTVHFNSHNLNCNVSDEKAEADVHNVCNICFKKFTAKKNLLKHLRDVHKNYTEAERRVVKKIKCPEKNCKFLCRMMKELRDHIEKFHKIKILKDTLQFPCEAVFQKWKKEEESNTVSWFVTGRKKTTLTDGTKKQTLYCHRTGHYSPKGFGKYRMRSVGSCKIGVTCPATMEVIESPNGELSVIYYKTHLGHLPDVVYLKLSAEERGHLAEKIKQGFSFDAILEDIKESCDFNKERKKKIHLLSKKDLYSIMRTENCSTKKTLKKEQTEEAINGRNLKKKETEAFQDNHSAAEKRPISEVAENFNQGFMLYSSDKVYPQNTQKNNLNETSSLLYQKYQKNIDIPQGSTEGIASQIVILSPDFDYSSVAEIILLSAGDGISQSVLSQPKVSIVESRPGEKTVSQTQTLHSKIVEVNKVNKSNLFVQLNEKVRQITDLLPHSENLTPKQFDVINTKLNGVLDILNIAKTKATAKMQNSKKKEIKQIKILKNNS